MEWRCNVFFAGVIVAASHPLSSCLCGVRLVVSVVVPWGLVAGAECAFCRAFSLSTDSEEGLCINRVKPTKVSLLLPSCSREPLVSLLLPSCFP